MVVGAPVMGTGAKQNYEGGLPCCSSNWAVASNFELGTVPVKPVKAVHWRLAGKLVTSSYKYGTAPSSGQIEVFGYSH